MSAYKHYRASPTLWLLIFGAACLPFADLSIHHSHIGSALKHIGWGFLTPQYQSQLLNADELFISFFNTLAFALQGVSMGVAAGFFLSLIQHHRSIRAFSAFIRAVHELFWALLFMQLFGLSSLTGVLAIAIPYAGFFSKVFAEHYAHTDTSPRQTLPNYQSLSAFIFTTLPQSWPAMRHYIRYRIECGLRSSAVLGFIGLPTLGFHLQTFFNEGHYSLSAFLLYIFIILVLTQRWWLQRKLIPFYLVAAILYLPPVAPLNGELLLRFFTYDVLPSPLRVEGAWNADKLAATFTWAKQLFITQAWPSIVQTFVLSQLALVVTGALSLCLFPLISKQFFSRPIRSIGHFTLVTLRSSPEYLLAFIGLLCFGPSLLPAIFALSIHNGSIIAHLIGQQTLTLRPDSSTSINRYFYEVLPRIYPTLMSLLLYRWEIILRESAILGILGITTLGFYIDSAFEEFRFDRAVFLILCSALLNIIVDRIATTLRKNQSPY